MLLAAYLTLVTAALSIACLFTLYAPKVSLWIPALTTYGKSSPTTKEPLLKAIEIPKKWFQHFYVLAVLNVIFWIVFPFWTHSQLLEFLTPVGSRVSATIAILVLILMLIHVARRCYETQSICIYSDSKMNIGHYAMGMIHYSILPLTVVCEAQLYRSGDFDRSDISLQQLTGIFLFFFCNYNQHMTVRQMASTRRSNGKISTGHGIFYGGWFDLVSCPHFLFEIGIYLSFWLLIPQAFTYQFMLIFVTVNQTFAAPRHSVFMLLFVFLIPLVVGDLSAVTTDPYYEQTQPPIPLSYCKSKNVTLSAKNPNWRLDPVQGFHPNQTCVYQITFPQGYTANLNVSVQCFMNFNGSSFGLDDAYGSNIGTNGGWSAQYMVDFPAPYLKITMKIGGPYSIMPYVDYLAVTLIPHKPFSGVVVVNNPKLDEAPRIYPIRDMNTSETLVFAENGNGNVSIIPLYMEYSNGPANLVNGHVYESVNGSWKILGTLNNVSHWNHRAYEKIGVYITRPIWYTTYLIGVLEANYHQYKSWNATMNLHYDTDDIGPVFCLDATEGPVAQTVWTSPDFFEASNGLVGTASYQIVEKIEFEVRNNRAEPITPTNDTVMQVYDNFPTANPGLLRHHWTIEDETSYLPALLVGLVKTFVLEKGKACITQQNVLDYRKRYQYQTEDFLPLWSDPSSNRKGFLSFLPEKGIITEYKFNAILGGADFDQPVNFFWQFTLVPGNMTVKTGDIFCTLNATYTEKADIYKITGPATDGASWDKSVFFWADSVVLNVHLVDQPIYLEFGIYDSDIRSSSTGFDFPRMLMLQLLMTVL